jgi:hypothetical protein
MNARPVNWCLFAATPFTWLTFCAVIVGLPAQESTGHADRRSSG